ncbi:SAM-dependent methyltransferase [Paenibacillus sp. Root52]|uniref:class I SAM-dependent methyltransferase n=1 Tax=Paenibacillus sp. Root52 TaxID=1736552 RepID=UPI0006FEBBD2|nr:class I SAM-dependent methyltransferase [Paenibacillus sp. Root52]KQY82617.1 SAM-dependent methyltransferase [Paenibacillus sp. Root52]
MQDIRRNNVDRFTGFGALYDQNRPSAPTEVVDILTTYLGHKPRMIADVGCGTGLSSWIWLHEADRIIGFEPSDDMRTVAESKWESAGKPDNLRFVSGLSHELGLPDDSVDILTCSQSFHWMEPQSTLSEFARVLRPGGIFAAYDCDWPPMLDWQLEQAYQQLVLTADNRALQLSSPESQAYKWSKDGHLGQIQQSGLFRYVREIVFHQRETFDADRYVNLALSQGGLQTALKLGADEVRTAADEFRQLAVKVFDGHARSALFSYRMRLGIV